MATDNRAEIRKVLIITLLLNLFVMSLKASGVGKRVDSPILIADAHHTMSDVWVTISIMTGLIGVWLGYQWLDLVLAFPVRASRF